MYKITANSKKTYATMELSGNFSIMELKKIGEELYQLAETMRPNFGLISDLSKLGKIPEGGKEMIADIMENMTKKGLAVVARVFPGVDSETLKKYMSASSKAGYETQYFANMERALNFMESKFK